MRAVLEDHKAIVAAIAAGDPQAATASLGQHLSGTIGRLPELRAERPEYFA